MRVFDSFDFLQNRQDRKQFLTRRISTNGIFIRHKGLLEVFNIFLPLN